MKKKNLVFIGIVVIGLVLITIPFWYSGNKSSESLPLAEGVHKVDVLEVTQTTKYTYLRVEEGKSEYWMAISKQEMQPGITLYYTNPLEMKNFESKELGKTFDKVYFVQQVSDNPDFMSSPAVSGSGPNAMSQRKQPEVRNTAIRVERLKGGISIAELYEFHPKYAGKIFEIRGEVTRFSPQIMGKNWVHIQDGTEFAGNFDLAISTQDSVAVGNVVVFSGIVRLNRDFGSGYFYKILLEDAQLKSR
jgi:hypothetical protein